MPIPEIGNLKLDDFGDVCFKDLPAVLGWKTSSSSTTSPHDGLSTQQPGDYVSSAQTTTVAKQRQELATSLGSQVVLFVVRKATVKTAKEIGTTIAKQSVISSADDFAKGTAVVLSKAVATKVAVVAASFGVVVDIGQLVFGIYRAWKRFRSGAMSKRSFVRFIVTRVIECVSGASGSIVSAIVCTILGTILGGPIGFVAGLGAGVGIGVVSWLIGKLVSWGGGKIYDWILDRLCGPEEPKAVTE